MAVFRRTTAGLSMLALALMVTPSVCLAQAISPGLSAGGINGAVGGGPAAGAVALPPPPAMSSSPIARPGIPTVAPVTPTFGGRRQSYGSGAIALPEGAYVPRRKHRHRRH